MRFVYLQVPNPKLVMFKNILSSFLLVFLIALVGKTFASTEPNLAEKNKTESDSLSVNGDKSNPIGKELNTPVFNNTSEDSSTSFWEKSEEVEEDSTSNSALSFNFIYYVIEKFKFQVE